MSAAKREESGALAPIPQVPAKVYELPIESQIVGKSLVQLLAMAPFNDPDARIHVRVMWPRSWVLWATIEQGWAHVLAQTELPQRPWQVVGYGPGFHDYKPTPGHSGQPGFPNDHYRKLVDASYTAMTKNLVVPDDQKGGVVSVVVRRPLDSFPNNLAALLPWLLGTGLLALGFAAGWFVHKFAG